MQRARMYNKMNCIAQSLTKRLVLYSLLLCMMAQTKGKSSPHTHTHINCTNARTHIYNKIPTHTRCSMAMSAKAARHLSSIIPSKVLCTCEYYTCVFFFYIGNKIATSQRDRFKRSFRFYSLSSPPSFFVASISLILSSSLFLCSFFILNSTENRLHSF